MPVSMPLARVVVLNQLARLPVDLGELLRRHVQIVIVPKPSPMDLQRGAAPDWRGLFLGVPLKASEEEPEIWRARKLPSGEEIAEPVQATPGGMIKIFVDNCRDEGELAEVLLHEVAHFFGEDEDDVAESGLGVLEREERPPWR